MIFTPLSVNKLKLHAVSYNERNFSMLLWSLVYCCALLYMPHLSSWGVFAYSKSFTRWLPYTFYPENAILAQSHNNTLHILVTLICFFKGKKLNSGLHVTARSNFISFEIKNKQTESFDLIDKKWTKNQCLYKIWAVEIPLSRL